jgi:hypothetical protein
LRQNAVLLSIGLVAMLSFGLLRKRPWLIASVSLIVFAFPFQPIEITLWSAPGGPKLMQCCPGAPYRDYESTLQKDRAGVCAFCSDISSGFNASWFWVW